MNFSIQNAEDLTSALRAELREAGEDFRTTEILPSPSPGPCLEAFLRFCQARVTSPLGKVDEDVVQLEASAVEGQGDPTGMHSPPGAYRMTLSRQVTIAGPDLEAIRIDEAALEIYFGTSALAVGKMLLVVPGSSASPSQLEPGWEAQYDGDLAGLAAAFRDGPGAALMDLPAQQGLLVASVLYDLT